MIVLYMGRYIANHAVKHLILGFTYIIKTKDFWFSCRSALGYPLILHQTLELCTTCFNVVINQPALTFGFGVSCNGKSFALPIHCVAIIRYIGNLIPAKESWSFIISSVFSLENLLLNTDAFDPSQT